MYTALHIDKKKIRVKDDSDGCITIMLTKYRNGVIISVRIQLRICYLMHRSSPDWTWGGESEQVQVLDIFREK